MSCSSIFALLSGQVLIEVYYFPAFDFPVFLHEYSVSFTPIFHCLNIRCLKHFPPLQYFLCIAGKRSRAYMENVHIYDSFFVHKLKNCKEVMCFM